MMYLVVIPYYLYAHVVCVCYFEFFLCSFTFSVIGLKVVVPELYCGLRRYVEIQCESSTKRYGEVSEEKPASSFAVP
jgi:hypothetical protein